MYEITKDKDGKYLVDGIRMNAETIAHLANQIRYERMRETVKKAREEGRYNDAAFYERVFRNQ